MGEQLPVEGVGLLVGVVLLAVVDVCEPPDGENWLKKLHVSPGLNVCVPLSPVDPSWGAAMWPASCSVAIFSHQLLASLHSTSARARVLTYKGDPNHGITRPARVLRLDMSQTSLRRLGGVLVRTTIVPKEGVTQVAASSGVVADAVDTEVGD
jgi:hypothetical protein